MLIHVQRNSKGIFRFILSALIISAIFIILLPLFSCQVSVGREPYHHGPGPRPPAPLPRIEGPWLINAYDLTGRLEFYWTGNIWTGRIWFDVLNKWEELTNIFIDPSTGQIQFFRPSFQQQYSGTLSGDRIMGTVVSGIGSWAGSLPWEAWREPYHRGPGARRPAPLPRIEGPWLINAYNLTGRLEFYWTGNIWTGRIWFDILNKWEELTNIFIDPSTGQIQFFRPSFQQQYSGTLSGDRIMGTVVSGIGSWAGSLPWEAWRRQ